MAKVERITKSQFVADLGNIHIGTSKKSYRLIHSAFCKIFLNTQPRLFLKYAADIIIIHTDMITYIQRVNQKDNYYKVIELCLLLLGSNYWITSIILEEELI